MLLTAAVASTPGLSAEAQSAYGNSNCIFAPDTQIAAGTNPFAVAVGDLNDDGVSDIAVANEGSNNVSILLATGAGTFAAAAQVAVGAAPQSVLVDDVSGDGKLDLIVANSGDGTLTVRFGTGTGTFGSAGTLPVGNGPRSLAVADLNNDGKHDLVVANEANSVSVLLGTGGGAFAAAMTHAVAGNPISVAIADFNADGKPDLAVASESNGSVSTLFGNGTGGFGAANPIPLGSIPKAVVSGDLNSDGKPDLAIANSGPDSVSILLGSSGGAFNAATQYPAHALGTAIAVADLDADGKSELVVANEIPNIPVVTVLRGLGGGTFAEPTRITYLGGAIPRGVAAGDFNADGIPDLVLANHASDNVSILLGDCAPTMNIAPNPNVDLTSSYELRKSPVWFDRQTYSPLTTFTHAVAHADLDRDARTDLLRASIESQLRVPLQVLMQTAGGGFIDRTNEVLTDPGPGLVWARKALSGDYNGDGWPDALFLDHGDDFNVSTGQFNQLFLSNGDGTLRYSPVLEGWLGFHHGGASADIDGNGTVDVMTMNAGGGGENLAYFLINDGQGNFSRSINRLPMELQQESAYTFELIDVDHDGFIDLLTAGGEYTEGATPATIYWGSSTGLYRAPGKTVFPLPVGYGGVTDFAAEDIDGDGDKDVIINRHLLGSAPTSRYFQILRQTAPREFVDETLTRMSMNTTTHWIDFIRVQDINGDSYPDIFVDDKGFVSKGEYAWTNNGQGVFAPYFGDVNPAVVTRQPADLALKVLDTASGSYAPGTSLIVNNQVENIGGKASDSYRLTFYASTDTNITPADVSLGFEDFTSLFVGMKRSYSNTVVQLPASLPNGQYYIGAIVAVADAKKSNNTKYDPVPITVDAAATPCDVYSGRIMQTGTDIKRITLAASAQSVDDTEAIECAFEAARSAGFGTVQLLAGDFYLSELKLQNFKGSFDGQSKANTRLHIIGNSVDCVAQIDQGRTTAVIRFVGGTPSLRNMSIHVNVPCTSGNSSDALIRFTGESLTADCDGSDLIFGSVDRVAIFGPGQFAPSGPQAAIVAAAEGAGTACRTKLLGTFKVNRSEIDGFQRGIRTSMHSGAQVDINYNTFTDNVFGYEMFDSNQITGVSFNDFTGGSTAQGNYFGVLVASLGSEAPATTAVTLLNNTFHLGGFWPEITAAFWAINDPQLVKINALLRGNRVLMGSDTVVGFNLGGIDGGVAIDNRFEGNGYAAAAVVNFGAEPMGSDNAFLANDFSGITSAVTGADILVGAEAVRTVIGPGQNADVVDTGNGTILTDNNLVVPP